MIADVDGTIVGDYGCWGEKKFMGRTFNGIIRRTFIIDGKGKIAHAFLKVSTKTHAAEVLAALREMK